MNRSKRKENVVNACIGATLGLILALFAYNNRETAYKPIETYTETRTTATVEEVTAGTVAEATTEEQTTEEIIQLYDVPLDAKLQLYIMDLCEEANISAALVIAVIERESNFNASAVGDSGNSLGLMQIQPKWHQWRMDELGGSDWFNPYNNVAVGVHILAGLFDTYGDDVYLVLMAYNGGASYAEKMASKGIVSDYAINVDARAAELERGEGNVDR